MIEHVGTQEIVTERLLLRRYEMTDAKDMFAHWVTDPETTRFWSWEPHKSIAQTRAALAGWIAAYENTANYHWVIVQRESMQAIGYIYLSEIDENERSCAVHFLLGRAFWNSGYMTEACLGVIEFAFGIGFETIRTRHHADNPASGRVFEKCGMRHIGTEYRAFPDCERISGDYLLYEITRKGGRI